MVVGTGIQSGSQMTPEARHCIVSSEEVLYMVADYATETLLRTLNPNAKSLDSIYSLGKPRSHIYLEMAEAIMDRVRMGLSVCAVFYGHPGVLVDPGHEVMRQAKCEGYEARMLPGISAEDCLFADLGVDPGKCGCQSFEATDFLVHKRKFDPSSAVVIWQIGMIGASDYRKNMYSSHGVKILVDVLMEQYGADHEVVVYEASPFPYLVAGPSIAKIRLAELAKTRIAPASTLYVPPMDSVPNHEMLRRLKLKPKSVDRRLSRGDPS